ncbi:hypothetical protein [Jeotgalicoccus halotolerans]|uniref:hypothetical protein n=1 Tax=Jeotgalicoccus halotolerans TaxID=157227 RepID=UPI0013BE9A51|nr:hypothetical protein [Jeotgalicoccus halotolerans]
MLIHSISFAALIIIIFIFLNSRVIDESKADVSKVADELELSKTVYENAGN